MGSGSHHSFFIITTQYPISRLHIASQSHSCKSYGGKFRRCTEPLRIHLGNIRFVQIGIFHYIRESFLWVCLALPRLVWVHFQLKKLDFNTSIRRWSLDIQVYLFNLLEYDYHINCWLWRCCSSKLFINIKFLDYTCWKNICNYYNINCMRCVSIYNFKHWGNI